MIIKVLELGLQLWSCNHQSVTTAYLLFTDVIFAKEHKLSSAHQLLHCSFIVSSRVYVSECVCVWACSVVSDSLWPPWTTAYQPPLSVEFSRQEYWSGLPFPTSQHWSNKKHPYLHHAFHFLFLSGKTWSGLLCNRLASCKLLLSFFLCLGINLKGTDLYQGALLCNL